MYVYAANNPSESILAKRRGYGTIISHNVSRTHAQRQQQPKLSNAPPLNSRLYAQAHRHDRLFFLLQSPTHCCREEPVVACSGRTSQS